MDRVDDYFYTILNEADPVLDFEPQMSHEQLDSEAEDMLARLVEAALEIVVAGSVLNLPATGAHQLVNWVATAPDPHHVSDRHFAKIAERTFNDPSGLQELRIRISLARSMTATLKHQGSDSSVESEHFWDVCSDAWRRVAQVNHGLMKQSVKDCADSELTRTAKILLEQLQAVCDGASPCINSDLQLEIPGFAEKRASERAELSADIVLFVKGQAHNVRIINQSQSGYGLEDVPDVSVDEKVWLKLPQGNTVMAVVRWCSDGMAGVEFCT
ncbi:MAG: PilZ domain-containing protein [Pseudomonadota bacterium]